MERLETKLNVYQGNIIGCLWKNPELYADSSINKKDLNQDGLFYYSLGEKLFSLRHDVFDETSVYSFVEGNATLKQLWDERSGYKVISELMAIVDENNYDSYIDSFAKYTILKRLLEKGFNIEKDWDKFEQMTAQDVLDYYEYMISDIGVKTNSDVEFENLTLTDDEIDAIEQGVFMGINYGEHSPQLNYLTMGLPKGDLTMIGSFVNGGKSSFLVNNIVIPVAKQGIKVHIISNEQRAIVFKLLLCIYVLTHELGYYKLTRKKLKSGNWTDEDRMMIQQAQDIINTKYKESITFTKLYNYDTNKIKKIIKRQAKRGYELIVYDTMKADNLTDGQFWQGVIEDSKALFQVASKENVAVVVSYQLALAQINRRYIDLSTLSTAKQVSEVFSEMVLFRDLWADEYTGEKFDVKAYRKLKDPMTGKYTDAKELITLDREKKYKVFFLAKTRNDEAGVCLLYEFRGEWNRWIEIGRCNVQNLGG